MSDSRATDANSRSGSDGQSPRGSGLQGRISLSLAVENFRQSLFFLPALFVLAAIGLALGTVYLDGLVDSDVLPGPLTTTVESSRSILGAIAAGTITAASVVLSLTLVAVQLSSGQHSPRVLRNFIGDRFQQVAIGIVLGTFVYCVLILRAVRAPLEDTGSPIVPNISIIFAIVLGIGALLAVLASVDHTASGLKVESIARQVTHETLEVIDERFPIRGRDRPVPAPQDPGATIARVTTSAGSAHLTRSPSTGWVRQMDGDAILAAVPAGSTVESRIGVGAYVMHGVALFAVAGVEGLDEDDRMRMDRRICEAIDVGNERTMQQDLDFGILRLQDIGMRALSPGVNDPGTAVEIVARLATVLRALIGRDLAGEREGPEGRRLVLSVPPDYAAYVRAGFDQMREAAGRQTVVNEAMLRALGHLRECAQQGGDADAESAIEDAAREVLACGVENAPLPRDAERLRQVADNGGFALS